VQHAELLLDESGWRRTLASRNLAGGGHNPGAGRYANVTLLDNITPASKSSFLLAHVSHLARLPGPPASRAAH
jgi:hypothetical protein